MENKEMILNKSRDIVMTNYDITAVENRMYNHILYNAQKEKNIDGIYKCKLKREEIIGKIIKNKSDQTREGIENVFDTLQNTKLIFWERKDNIDIKKDYNLISGKDYRVQEDTWIVVIPEVIYTHLTQYYKLSKCYAPLNLEITSKFKSFYAQRMYELLRLWSRYNKEIEHKFSLEEIRFVLGVEHKYPQYKNFKQKVLLVCKKELEEKANMLITFEELKTGRSVSHLSIKVVDGEPKRYFRDFKISDLRNINIDGLDENIKEIIENEILDLEDNAQVLSQDSFENKVKSIKNIIYKEIEKTKEIEKYFENAIFDKFKIEYKINLTDENIKIQILEAVSKTLANTESKNERIYAKNYSYFKSILNNSLEINNDKIPKGEYIEDIEDIEQNDSERLALVKIEKIKGMLQLEVEQIQYDTWISPLLDKANIKDNVLLLKYKEDWVLEVIKTKFIEKINKVIKFFDISSCEFVKEAFD